MNAFIILYLFKLIFKYIYFNQMLIIYYYLFQIGFIY